MERTSDERYGQLDMPTYADRGLAEVRTQWTAQQALGIVTGHPSVHQLHSGPIEGMSSAIAGL